MLNPLHQFEVRQIFQFNLFGIDLSLNISNITMITVCAILLCFFVYIYRNASVIPSRGQVICEIMYSGILDTLNSTIGQGGIKFFPLVFTTFLFIMSCNLFGLLPYSFTVTSQIVVNFVLAMFIFVIATVYGFVVHGFKFLRLFVPHGIPYYLAPLMFVIELCAYCTRPFSLAVRLGANMMAGHVLLKVIASFVVSMHILFKFVPIAFVGVLLLFEFGVAILQSYIFAMLSCLYINDAVNLH